MSSGSVSPFTLSGSVTVAATTTSATVRLPTGGDVVVITNLTTSAAYVALGQAAAIGGANGVVVLPGEKRVLATNIYTTSVSAILVSGAGNIVIEVGYGTVF